MGRHNGSDPTVWMEATADHTYEGKAQPIGAIYLAHEDLVETIENLKFAKRVPPPPVATRPEPTTESEAPPAAPATPMTTETAQPLTPPSTRTRRGR